MLKIGDFSKLSRISIRMLRYYDEIGLLMPKSTDDFTGYRYYAEDQLPIAMRIISLKEMGFGLYPIKEIMVHYDNPAALAEFLTVKQAEVAAEAQSVQQGLQLLDTAICLLRKDTTAMNHNVILKTFPQRYVASVRQIIPSYDQEGKLWQILMSETASLNMQDGDPCYTLAVFHDGEHKDAQVDVEVQKTVKGSYANTANVVFKTEPPVLIASATYKGSYDQMNQVNQAVAQWVQANGYDFNGVSFFIYHISPYETQDPNEYVTEICYPVKKRV